MKILQIFAVVVALLSPLSYAQVVSSESPLKPVVERRPVSAESVRPFGYWLFSGMFAEQGFSGYAPELIVSTGDAINVSLWGAYESEMELVVDAQGNIFLPRVGPVRVAGVSNRELPSLVERAVSRVYSKHVSVYAKLSVAKPVKVYVTGYVASPGLYAGHSSDSVLRFLDLSGGVLDGLGSYRNVLLKRQGEVVDRIDLYDFITDGVMASRLLRDGDVLVVEPISDTLLLDGFEDDVSLRYEIIDKNVKFKHILDHVAHRTESTHVRVVTEKNGKSQTRYLTMPIALDLTVTAGDRWSLVRDVSPQTYSVRIDGEHLGEQEVVIGANESLGDVLAQVTLTKWSDMGHVYLYRESVKARQKEMLERALSQLESSIFTARSNTTDEAGLRTMEAELLSRWVEKARQVELKGQVVISQGADLGQFMLEPNDVIVIPKKSNVVMVHGEVVAPMAGAYLKGATVNDYLEMAGGFSQTSGSSKVLIVSRGGAFQSIDASDIDSVVVKQGDEIIVIPEISTKSLQVTKDLTQVIYQIAVSAGTVLSLVL
ncbi:polysaccharide biosynthesis/export family protein [Vibrio sp. PNB22_3_1]